MTVNTELASAVFTWTGVETSFSCGFPADKVADLRVVFRTAAGTDYVLALGVNYTATLANTTKLVTIAPVAIPGGSGKIIVTRSTPALVPEVLADGQQFSLAVVQALHDKAAMRSAEDRERFQRALVLREGQTLGDGEFDLGGSGIVNGAPATTANGFVVLSQIQDIVAAGGDVPAPTVDQVGQIIEAISAGVFAWRPKPLAVPSPLEADLTKALVAIAPGVYGWQPVLGNAVQWAIAQTLTSPQKAQARANISAASSDQIGQRNLLINAGFRINQRGFAGGALAAGAYGHDRWKAAGGGASYTVTAGVATISSGSIAQVIEGASIEVSGDYTINWSGTASCTIDGETVAKGDQVTLTAGSNCTVAFSAGTVSFAQIEPGGVASSFEQRPFGHELLLCQRYFERFGNNDIVGAGFCPNTTEANAVLVYKQKKRATPTITFGGAAADYRTYVAATSIASTIAPTAISPGVNHALIVYQATGFTAGQGCMLMLINANATVDVSAEL